MPIGNQQCFQDDASKKEATPQAPPLSSDHKVKAFARKHTKAFGVRIRHLGNTSRGIAGEMMVPQHCACRLLSLDIRDPALDH